MPAPPSNVMAELAKANFAMNLIQLPMEWEDMGDQFPDAFAPDELMAPPNPPAPVTLFNQSTLNRYHVDTAGEMSNAFSDYIDGICSAICDGIDRWMQTTTIVGVIINGPIGMLSPGNVVGSVPLQVLIQATAPSSTLFELRYSTAIASAFGTLWQAWSMGITGTLLYPAFAAITGPIAPPMPNIPIPLLALPSVTESILTPSSLKSLMEANLADPTALHASELFDAIAMAFNVVFQVFKASTLVQNVLGTGPVPTFAPPFVPVGPVLAGVGIGPPGCIS